MGKSKIKGFESQGSLSSERGASLVEYALLLALIVVVCVGAMKAIGSAAEERFKRDADAASEK
jgi:Flp pilus assembly pilin Flp